jgi:hypothetical protein
MSVTERRSPVSEPKKPRTAAQINWFQNGYQSALADVLAAFGQGGEAAAREWIALNSKA